MTEGWLPLAIALGFVVGLVVERLLLRWRWDPYFRVGLVLMPEPLPIPRAPEGRGSTQTVEWEVVAADRVRFWAAPGSRQAPMGLHGTVQLVQTPRGLRLAVRWSPPWSPVLACVWVAGLGVARGDGLVLLPTALVILGVIAYVYRQYALTGAAQMRWQWVSQGED